MKTATCRHPRSIGAYGYGLVAYLVLAMLSTWALVVHPGIIGHNWDWPIDWNFEGINDLKDNAFSAWSDVGLGGPNIAVSNALYYYILAAFHDPKLLSDGVLVLTFPLGALSGMFLVRQTLLLVGIEGFWGAWLGGLTFGFSPFFFNEFQGGVLSQLLGHMGFALVLGLVTIYARTGRKVWLAIAAAASLLLDSSVTDFILSFPVVFILLCLPPTRASLSAFGAYALGALGINMYWLLSFLHTFVTVTGRGAAFDTLRQNLSNQAPQVWELFTNSGYPYSFYDHTWKPIVFVAGIATIAIFYGALLFVGRAHMRLITRWLVLVFVGIGVSSVANGPFSVVMVWAYQHVPFMKFLRTPQHLIIVPALAFSVVIGVGWGAFLGKPRSHYLLAAIVALFLIGRAPYFTGDLSSSLLSSSGPGRALSLFQVSPGYIRAARSIDSAPHWSRALFIPSTFSPLYVASPFQEAAQGGDPFVLNFIGHGSLLADGTGTMSRSGNELTSVFNSRLPESLSTGMPELFDASRLILRYDVLVNGGFGDYALDGELPYRIRSYLKEHAQVWGSPTSDDLVDIYSSRPPGRVFLSTSLLLLNGDAADVPDLETVAPSASFAFDAPTVRLKVNNPSLYQFQEQWDDEIDKASSARSRVDVRAVNRVRIGESGNYVVLLHRRSQGVPVSLTLSVDNVEIEDQKRFQSGVQAFTESGALWIPSAVVYLRRGRHDIDLRVGPEVSNGLIGDVNSGIRDYFNRLAVLPLADVPRFPDFSYHDGVIVGMRIPSSGEARHILLAVKKAGIYRVSALVRMPRADRDFPVVAIKGAALSRAPDIPFISQEGTPNKQTISLPLYWYVQNPVPRIGPAVDVQYIGQPLGFTVTSSHPFRGVFVISLSGVNMIRTATLNTEDAKTTKALRGALGPFNTLSAATMFSAHPVNVSVPIEVSGTPQHVDVTLTPATDVLGMDRGLPLGMNLGASVRSRGEREIFRPNKIASAGIIVPANGHVTLSHSIPDLPTSDLSELRIAVLPNNVVSVVNAEANVYLRCANELRIYQMPVTKTVSGGEGLFSADLTTLRTLRSSLNCAMYGFSLRMRSSLNDASLPMRIQKAQVFARNPWLEATRPIIIERSMEDGTLRLQARLSIQQRILSIGLATGSPPAIQVTVNGNPLGEQVLLSRWQLTDTKLPLHDVLIAAPESDGAATVLNNPGRTTLVLAGRAIPEQEQAQPDGPYWYLEKGSVYLAWPRGDHFPARGHLVVIPSNWFNDHGSHQELELDAEKYLTNSTNVLLISVRDERYSDASFAIAAYKVSATPKTSFPFTIDGRAYSLRMHNITASVVSLSDALAISLKSGLHSVGFDSYSNGIRLYFKRKDSVSTVPHLVTPIADSSLSSLWRVSIPARKSAMALIFLESFDKDWTLQGLSGTTHFVADGYANGWILPPGKATSITLYYRGENWIEYGAVISGFVTIILLVWILGETPRCLRIMRKRTP